MNEVYADQAGELHYQQHKLGQEAAKNELRYISADENVLRTHAVMMLSFYNGYLHYINNREEYEREDNEG